MYLTTAPLIPGAGIISPAQIFWIYRFEDTIAPLITIRLARPSVGVVSSLVTFCPLPGSLVHIVTQSNPVEDSLDKIIPQGDVLLHCSQLS